jgi:hypothetical protein
MIKNENSQIKLLFLSCLLPAATFFIFGPIDLYANNAQELWFSLKVTAATALICGVLAVAVSFIIGCALPKKIQSIYVSLLFGLGLALYFQANFLQLNYGVLDGKDVDWSQYTVWGYFNTFIWCLCLALPFLLNKFRPNAHDKTFKTISMIIIGVQIFTLIYLTLTMEEQENTSYYLSDKNIFSLSKDKNIVILLLDAFDVQYMDALLEKYPELHESFTDFTYYKNTVEAYTTTRFAVPHILTGKKYKNEEGYNQYIKNAYNNSVILNILHNQRYAIEIYGDSAFVSPEASYVENLVASNLQPDSFAAFTKLLYQFVSIKYFPHSLKENVWMYSGDFYKIKNIVNDDLPLPYKFFDDKAFYHSLKKQRLSVDMSDNRKRFKYYHFAGSHGPYILNEKLETVPREKTDALLQTRGALKITEEFLEQLKQIGQYDNTFVIIMADHGFSSYFPTLMIKPWNERKPFQVSQAPLSYEDLLPTLLNVISGGKEGYGKTIYDYNEGQERERLLLFSTLDVNLVSSSGLKLVEYSVSDLKHYRPTGVVYAAPRMVTAALPYKLGTKLSLHLRASKAEEALKYFTHGMSWPEPTGTWSQGNTTDMEFVLQEKPAEDLAVKLESFDYFLPKGRPQQLIFFANGKQLREVKLTPKTPLNLSFTVPKELVTDRRLSLRFEYPEAISPQAAGVSTDTRVLAVAFKSLVIEEVDGNVKENGK